MFKKPLASLKTSAPLRSSDRRKLRQRVVTVFQLTDDAQGDELVPDGILSIKFSTHLDELGVAFLSADGDPLWFTIGKGTDGDLIPTVYTLWKCPDLLPTLSTPPAVIPVLVGGADLMIPGVISHSPSLRTLQLVAITQHTRTQPLAVGRMAIDSDAITRDGKGKAVHVLHTWKDHLWAMGRKGDIPEVVQEDALEVRGEPIEQPETEPNSSKDPEVETQPALSPQEVSTILCTSLIHAISTTLSVLPPSSFPLPATQLWENHILPARPALVSTSTPIDIKHSTHRSLTTFLRTTEKEGLLRLKEMKPVGLVIIGVFPKHAAVAGHQGHLTLREVGKREERRRAQQQQQEAETAKPADISIRELWKPWQKSLVFFTAAQKDTGVLYTQAELKSVLETYVKQNELVNPVEQQYIDLDAPLISLLASTQVDEGFMKREALLVQLIEQMQPWHEIQPMGASEAVLKKGALRPVRVSVRLRQGGRKASTIIVGLESFGIVAEELAEELRKVCAGATSVSPGPGNAELEVLVQGKQVGAASEALIARGVPKKWIDAVGKDGSGKAKGKAK